MKLDFFPTDFREILKYQISWKSVMWEPSCFNRKDRRTDRHDEANRRFSEFCEHAWKRENMNIYCRVFSTCTLQQLATANTRLLSTHILHWILIRLQLNKQLIFFCSMTNKCTIISQIITLLHVSTVFCHPQGACNQYLAKLHKYSNYSCW
jgi:hypothetical protein